MEKKLPSDITPEQAKAIDIAEEEGLGAEIEYCIFELGMSPEEALKEVGAYKNLLHIIERYLHDCQQVRHLKLL